MRDENGENGRSALRPRYTANMAAEGRIGGGQPRRQLMSSWRPRFTQPGSNSTDFVRVGPYGTPPFQTVAAHPSSRFPFASPLRRSPHRLELYQSCTCSARTLLVLVASADFPARFRAPRQSRDPIQRTIRLGALDRLMLNRCLSCIFHVYVVMNNLIRIMNTMG